MRLCMRSAHHINREVMSAVVDLNFLKCAHLQSSTVRTYDSFMHAAWRARRVGRRTDHRRSTQTKNGKRIAKEQ